MWVTPFAFAFLANCLSAELYKNGLSRSERPGLENSIEEKLEDGYQPLRNQRNANDTEELLEKLHKIYYEAEDEFISSPEEEADLLNEIEQYVEIRAHQFRAKGGSIQEINDNSNLSTTLFEGDIILTKEQGHKVLEEIKDSGGRRNKRHLFRNKTRLWPGGVVYYSFAKNATEAARSVYLKATEEWSKDTCIDFKQNDTATDRVVVFYGYGCYTQIGRIGGIEPLSLGDNCESVGFAAHEIGHNLGLGHTHARHDRKRYIKLLKININEEYDNEFTIQDLEYFDSYNIPYEYGSVMHYGPFSTSRSGLPVMIPRDVKYWQTLGSHIISHYDKLLVNLHYGCFDRCKRKSSNICRNGGFLHPRHCDRCVCPRGYGGKYCDEKPKDCGEILYARTSFQMINNTVGRKGKLGSNDRTADYKTCTYWIKAPPGYTIEVILDSYSEGADAEGCPDAGVEIKTGNDTSLTGYRLCYSTVTGKSFNSTHNVVPIIMYNRVSEKTAVLRYRIASSNPNGKCSDNFLCKGMLKVKPCTETNTGNIRRKLCPKSCGYC